MQQVSLRALLTREGRSGRRLVRSILLAEDDASVRELLARWLEPLAGELVVAASAAEALRAVEDGAKPDLIVADVHLRDLDGQTLADQIRARRDRVAVLLISGHSHEHLLAVGTVRASSGFVQKPFTHHAFDQAVQQALSDEADRADLKAG